MGSCPKKESENDVVGIPPLGTPLSSTLDVEKSMPPPVCGNGDNLLSAFNRDWLCPVIDDLEPRSKDNMLLLVAPAELGKDVLAGTAGTAGTTGIAGTADTAG